MFYPGDLPGISMELHFMRSCDDHPRHAHRTPSEIAEDEGVYCLTSCQMDRNDRNDRNTDASLQNAETPKHFALLTWRDAHPLSQLTR